jgi:pre-60S factor REI1
MDEGPPEINPSQSLFDSHTSASPAANLKYMESKYSFYLPDREYCVDLEGFLGYCNEKVRWGNICLYCQKQFGSTDGVVKHMKDKAHCKVQYERGVDQEEFDVFYDFSEANREFLGESAKPTDNVEDDEEWEDVEDDDGEGEWEDASMEDGEQGDDDDLYAAYESEIATHGFDITPLGELVFPDGRIVGHRGLARYYKQRFAPDRLERAAVRHAKEAAGDRLYGGRVVNLYRLNDGREESNESPSGAGAGSSTALATMGRMAGSIPTGRNGKGILVAGEGRGGFTSLSLYRYKAAVKKQRREDARGQRLQYRSTMNMNKMGKKGNRLNNGLVTALMPR